MIQMINRGSIPYFLSGVLLLSLGFGSFYGHAEVVQFFGSAAYNDGASDAVNNRCTGARLSMASGGGFGNYAACYKLNGCHILLSNVSQQTMKITGYDITITQHFSSWMSASTAGLYPDPSDIFFLTDGTTAINWLAWSTRVSWTSGSTGPSYVLYKFTHNSDHSDMTPSQGYVSSSDMSLSPGESAFFTVGNAAYIYGGILLPSVLDGVPSTSPFKSFLTCHGSINVSQLNDNTTTTGFLVGSGAIDTKAGAYFNDPISYGVSMPSDYSSTGITKSYTAAFSAAVRIPGTYTAQQFGAGVMDVPYVSTFPVTVYSYTNPSGYAMASALDNQYLWSGDRNCTIDSIPADPVLTADWPEINISSPFAINGGEPVR